MQLSRQTIIRLSNGTELTNVTSGSLNLNQMLTDGELTFGKFCTDKFECQVFGTSQDYSGLGITVSVIDNSFETVRFTSQPDNIETPVGQTAVYSVTAQSTVGGTLTYQWQASSDEGRHWVNSGLTGNKTRNLRVAVTNARDSYLFRCVVSDGTSSNVSNIAYLKVADETQSIPTTGEIKSFSGVIDSCDRDYTNTYRNIVAYSFNRQDEDVTQWWEDFWDTHTSATLKTLRQSLITHMGLEEMSGTLHNDSLSVKKSTTTNLTFQYVLESICQLQACFPHVYTDGRINYITLDTTTKTIDKYDIPNTTWKDSNTEQITGVAIYSSSSDLVQSFGTMENPYIIAGNMFLLNKSASELDSFMQSYMSILSTVIYTPCNVSLITTDFDYRLGDKISFANKVAYVMQNTISGVQWCNQSMIATGEIKRNKTAELSQVQNNIIDNYKYSKIEQDIDNVLIQVGATYATKQDLQNSVNELQSQIDGAISTYTGAVVPTLSNYPANEWTTTALKDSHLGDVYIVNSEGGEHAGHYYRFEKLSNGTYQWALVEDTQVVKALQDAAAALQGVDDINTDLNNNYYTKTATDSAIQASSDSILQTVSGTYATAQVVNNLKNTAITNDVIHYLATPLSSGVTTETAGWTTTPQALTTTNKYLWTYHTYTYGDGHTEDTTPTQSGVYGNTGAKGDKGDTGETSPTYVLYASMTAPKDGTITATLYKDGEVATQSAYMKGYVKDASATEWGESSLMTGNFVGTRSRNYAHTLSTYAFLLEVYTSSSMTTFLTSALVSFGDTGIGITDVVTLYYANNRNTKPNAPTSPVTTSTTDVGVWTQGVPALTTTYKYLYTCNQVKYTDNTYVWTTVVLDDAITKLTERVSNAEFNLQPEQITAKVESTQTFVLQTDYDDTLDEIETIETNVSEVTQTANKINWLVQSGTSSSNFALTDRTADLVANYINLHGKVTFNGLDSSTQDQIELAQDIADNIYTENTTTIDGGKITANTIKAIAIDVANLFAQNLTASNFNITGGSININTSSDEVDVINLKYQPTSNSVIQTYIAPAYFKVSKTDGSAMRTDTAVLSEGDLVFEANVAQGSNRKLSISNTSSFIQIETGNNLRSVLSSSRLTISNTNTGTIYVEPTRIAVSDTNSTKVALRNSYPQVVGDGTQLHLNFVANTGSGVILATGVFRPATDNDLTLGASNKRWKQIYSTNSTISTSDRNEKHDIEAISDEYIKLFDLLEPVTYMRNGGDRTHTGFISQDVEKALTALNMTAEDFAGFCKDKIEENQERYALRYEEFIALNTAKIKQQETRINELENEVAELKAMVKKLLEDK